MVDGLTKNSSVWCIFLSKFFLGLKAFLFSQRDKFVELYLFSIPFVSNFIVWVHDEYYSTTISDGRVSTNQFSGSHTPLLAAFICVPGVQFADDRTRLRVRYVIIYPPASVSVF